MSPRRVWLGLVVAALTLAACSSPNIAGVGGSSSPGLSTSGATTGSDQSGYSVGSNSGQSSSLFSTVQSQVSAGLTVSSLPPNLTPSLAAAQSDMRLPDVPAMVGCFVGPESTDQPACEYPAEPGKPIMVLLGDSHAVMWAKSIIAIGQQLGYDIVVVAKSNCAPALVPFLLNSTASFNSSCATWQKAAITRITSLKPKVVVVTGNDFDPYGDNGRQMSQSTYSAGLEKTLKDLSAPGRQVVLLGDISYLSQDGPSCLAAHSSDVQACTTLTPAAAPVSHYQAQEAAANAVGASYVNVIPWLCTKNACPAVIDGIEVYHDRFHITDTYAAHIQPLLAAALALQHV